MPGARSFARPWAPVALAFVLYLGYACFTTWPVVIDLDGRIVPRVGGDLSGAIAHAREVVEERIFPFAPGRIDGFNYPNGLAEEWVLNWATLPGTGLLYGLSYLLGAQAGHNVFMLLGYALSGTAMFALVRWLVGSTAIALLAGFAFAFHPFVIGKGEAHLHFIHGWVLVLLAWRMLVLAQDPSARNGLLAGLAAAFAIWFTPYFVLIAGVEFMVLAAVACALGAMAGTLGRAVRAVALACVPVVVLLAGLGVLSVVAGGEGSAGPQTSSLDELTQYAARAHELVLPDRNNLIFGDRTRGYLESHLHGSNFSEASVYLGVSVLLLALFGAVATGRLVMRRRREAAHDRAFAGGVAGIATALVALAFAAPPKLSILGMLVPTPSWFVFQLTSTWRVYSRFVVLIMLGLALLLAVGLAVALARRSPAVRGTVVGCLAVVLVLDLWARPDVRPTKTVAPDAYLWLRDHPGGAVAELPLLPAPTPEYQALFWQGTHDHPILQGYNEASEDESMKIELNDPVDAETAPDLAALGAKYVVTRPDSFGDVFPDLERHGFRPVFERPDLSVWEVVAPPSRARVDALDGFAPPEGEPDAHYRWMGEPTGLLGVFAADCERCSGTVHFRSTSNGVRRTLIVRDVRSGRVVRRAAVPVGPKSVTVAVPVELVRGKARLRLETDVPASAAPAPDVRRLSVTVIEPRFERRAP